MCILSWGRVIYFIFMKSNMRVISIIGLSLIGKCTFVPGTDMQFKHLKGVFKPCTIDKTLYFPLCTASGQQTASNIFRTSAGNGNLIPQIN